jgi:hypothetical protein
MPDIFIFDYPRSKFFIVCHIGYYTFFYRFDEELTALLLRLKWWDLPTGEIRRLIPLLHNSDLEVVKTAIQAMLQGST